jgi:pimeloyl-ACP methyl ester carboxylesterase
MAANGRGHAPGRRRLAGTRGQVVKRSGAARLGSFLVWGLAILLAAGASQSRAEEVSTEHQGLDVLGNLEIAQGKSLRRDGAVLLLHGSLGHHRMEIISAAQELLRERGINSLAITLSLGLDRRRGMFDCSLVQDHRHDDAVGEIGTWIDWLKEQGASNVTLAGHDRGASQAALYAGQPKADRVVRRLILISPMMQNFEVLDREYFLRYKKVLRDELAEAEEMISRDEASSLMTVPGFLDCPNARVTAGAFADYYASNPKFSTPNLLPAVKTPILVIGAELDPQEQELASAMRSLAGDRQITFEEVPGADRFFRDAAADELADRIKEFLGRKLQAPPAAAPHRAKSRTSAAGAGRKSRK